MRRRLEIDLLDDIIRKLAGGEQLPEKNKDHALTVTWVGHRECHIQPDWLLIYRIENDLLVLTLAKAGSHSDLFGKYGNAPGSLYRVHFLFLRSGSEVMVFETLILCKCRNWQLHQRKVPRSFTFLSALTSPLLTIDQSAFMITENQ